MKEAAFRTIHKSSKINGQSRLYHLKKKPQQQKRINKQTQKPTQTTR